MYAIGGNIAMRKRLLVFIDALPKSHSCHIRNAAIGKENHDNEMWSLFFAALTAVNSW